MEKLAFPRENYGADPPLEFSNLFDPEQREPTADSITKGPTPGQIEPIGFGICSTHGADI